MLTENTSAKYFIKFYLFFMLREKHSISHEASDEVGMQIGHLVARATVKAIVGCSNQIDKCCEIMRRSFKRENKVLDYYFSPSYFYQEPAEPIGVIWTADNAMNLFFAYSDMIKSWNTRRTP
jgi:hypothetical protein